MKKILFILTLSILAQAGLFAQEEGLRSRLERDSILIGDQVRWSAPLTLEQGEEFAFVPPQEPVAPGVETIVGFGIDTLSARRGKLEVEGRMVLTAFDSGSFALPPLYALVRRSGGAIDTLVYEPPVLEVNTIPIDTATFQPYDIKGQMKYPLTFAEVYPWVLLALVLVAAIWALVRYIVYRRQDKDFFGRPKVVDPPHIVALRSLEKIRGQKLCQNGKQKQFYTAVTDTLRRYMADRYGFQAMEQTSAEIFDSLKDKEIDERLMERVKDLFTTADFVKFAKHNASDQENEEAIPTAVSFVNSTFMQQLEDEKSAEEEK
ncbi:MAG: hypothetical protein IKR30_00480 [Bacteroidales bacterium]|nr:hypothetical protein [Bacteroidales bacterium]